MKIQTISLLLLVAFTLITSCSDDNSFYDETTIDETTIDETTLNEIAIYNETIINLGRVPGCDSLTGVCLQGPSDVAHGETHLYGFQVGKRENGHNINEVVNWDVISGNMEVVYIQTTLLDAITVSIGAIKFGDDFTGGILKVSTDKYSVESDPLNSHSFIQIPIYAN